MHLEDKISGRLLKAFRRIIFIKFQLSNLIPNNFEGGVNIPVQTDWYYWS